MSASGQSVAFLNDSINADMLAQNDLISQERYAANEQGSAAKGAANAAISMASHQAAQTMLQADESFTQGATSIVNAGMSSYQLTANDGQSQLNQAEYANNSTTATKTQIPTNPTVQPKAYTDAVAKAKAAPPGSAEATPPNRSDYNFSDEELNLPTPGTATPPRAASTPPGTTAAGAIETPPEDEDMGAALLNDDESTPIHPNRTGTASTASSEGDDENLVQMKINTAAHDGVSPTPLTAAKTEEEQQTDDDIRSLVTTGRLPDPEATQRRAWLQSPTGDRQVDTTSYPSDSEIQSRTKAAFDKMTPEQQNEAIAQAKAASPKTEATYRSALDAKNAASQRTSASVNVMNALFTGMSGMIVGGLKTLEAAQANDIGQAQANQTLYQNVLQQMTSVLGQTISNSQGLAQNEASSLSTYAAVVQAGKIG